MSLKAFHLLFIAMSIVLAAFVAAWAGNEYRTAHELSYALAGLASLVTACALAVYGAAFRRKMREL